jgi:hypothetical protein
VCSVKLGDEIGSDLNDLVAVFGFRDCELNSAEAYRSEDLQQSVAPGLFGCNTERTAAIGSEALGLSLKDLDDCSILIARGSWLTGQQGFD